VYSNAGYNDLTSVPDQLRHTPRLTHLILWVLYSEVCCLRRHSNSDVCYHPLYWRFIPDSLVMVNCTEAIISDGLITKRNHDVNQMYEVPDSNLMN